MGKSLDAFEQQQHYLQAMGLKTWLPTEPLPGAGDDAYWCWNANAIDPIDAEGQRTSPSESPGSTNLHGEPKTSAPHNKSPIASLKAAVAAETPITPQSPPSIAPATTDTASAAQSEDSNQSGSDTELPSVSPVAVKPNNSAEVPRFRLAMVAYDDCIVMAQLPMDVLQALAPEHHRLIHRILLAIGLGQGEPQTQRFAWPVVNNPNVDQSLVLAQASIARLEQRLDTQHRPLLIFGEPLVDYLGLPSELYDKAQRVQDRVIIQAPTLNQLMSIPGLKRELWAELQLFRQLLDE